MIRHENGACPERFSNQRNLKTPALGFTIVNGGDPPLPTVLVWTKSILNTERFEKDGVAISLSEIIQNVRW